MSGKFKYFNKKTNQWELIDAGAIVSGNKRVDVKDIDDIKYKLGKKADIAELNKKTDNSRFNSEMMALNRIVDHLMDTKADIEHKHIADDVTFDNGDTIEDKLAEIIEDVKKELESMEIPNPFVGEEIKYIEGEDNKDLNDLKEVGIYYIQLEDKKGLHTFDYMVFVYSERLNRGSYIVQHLYDLNNINKPVKIRWYQYGGWTDWVEYVTIDNVVTSINGKQGDAVLTGDDIVYKYGVNLNNHIDGIEQQMDYNTESLLNKADNNELGDIGKLETNSKSNVVNAINELVDKKQDRPLIYGVEIDESNANPETRVKYIEDSVGFKPVRGNDGNVDWGSWKNTWIYENFKPCVLKDGEVQYYLDKEDLTKKENGTSANLSGADGDVMIEIDKVYNKIERVGSKLKIMVSDREEEGFTCLAHTNGNKEVDKIYIGRYLGYEQNGKLRSISGREPTGNKTIGEFRDLAEANGTNYHQVPFYALTLLQSIMVIMFKNTDTQTALGRGHVDDSSEYSKTGGTNKKGMMFGETKGQADTGQVCFMGIEDFWGNKRWWIDGCKYDSGSIKTATTSFNNNASGYMSVGSFSESNWGYIKTVKGTSETGFIPTNTDGSNSTFFCDEGRVHDGRFPFFGGFRSGGSDAGGFYLYSFSASDSYVGLGSRLFMYGK